MKKRWIVLSFPQLTGRHSKFVLFLFILFLVSCKETPVKFGQLKYNAKDLNKWIKDSARYKGLVFQFYYDTKKDNNKVIESLAYVVDSSGAYVNATKPDTLRMDESLKDSPIVFDENFVLGNSGISLKRIRAIINAQKDSSGNGLLHFLPKKDSVHHHVFYNLSYSSNNIEKKNIGDSDPCPPLVCHESFD